MAVDITAQYGKNTFGRAGQDKPTMEGRNLSLTYDKELGRARVNIITQTEEELLQAAIKGSTKRLEEQKKHTQRMLDAVTEQETALKNRLEAIKDTGNAKEIMQLEEQLRKVVARRQQFGVDIETLERDINKRELEMQEKVNKAKQIAEQNFFAHLEADQKIQYLRQLEAVAKQEAQKAAIQEAAIEDEIETEKKRNERLLEEQEKYAKQQTSIKRRLNKAVKEGDKEKQKQLEAELAQNEARLESTKHFVEESTKSLEKLREEKENATTMRETSSNEASVAKDRAERMEKARLQAEAQDRTSYLEAEKKNLEAEKKKLAGNIAADSVMKEELEAKKAAGGLSEEEQAQLDALNENIKNNKQALEENNKELNKTTQELKKQELAKKLEKAVDESFNKIDEKINALYKNSAKYNARLYGAGFMGSINILNPFTAINGQMYNKLLNTVSQRIGINPLISQTAIVQNIQRLIDMGVAQNIELRAYLATITDQVASTFDALDGTLMRLERVQQADTTAIRLGMEQALLTFFNKNFKDSTFMSDVHDAVFQAVYDANALMTKEESTEFEYNLQKWLGSLYSVGMSQSGVETIAKGINYLGTGNYEGLAGDEKLQNILAMSASRAGLNYAEILQKGIDTSSLNKLMEAMVGYLRDIAQNTIDNKVVASAFSNVFGMSVSDMSAILNLSDQDIQNIARNTMSYEQMGNNLMLATSRILRNTHISQLTNNLFDNLITTTATGIGDSVVNYAIWKIASTLMDLGIDFEIPFVNVWGFGIDLHTSIMRLVKLGVTGIGLLGQLLSGIFSGIGADASALFSGGGYEAYLYNAWNATQITERGQTRQNILQGKQSYKSYSVSMAAPFVAPWQNALEQEEDQEQTQEHGGGNTSDIQNQALTEATDSASDTNEVVGGHEDLPERTLDDLYDALFTYHFPVYTVDMISIGKMIGSSSQSNSEKETSEITKIAETYNAVFEKMLKIPEIAGDKREEEEATTYKQKVDEFSELNAELVKLAVNSDQTVVVKDFGETAQETLLKVLTEYLKKLLEKLGATSTGGTGTVGISEQYGEDGQVIPTTPEVTLMQLLSGSSADSPIGQILTLLQGAISGADSINVKINGVDQSAWRVFV